MFGVDKTVFYLTDPPTVYASLVRCTVTINVFIAYGGCKHYIIICLGIVRVVMAVTCILQG